MAIDPARNLPHRSENDSSRYIDHRRSAWPEEMFQSRTVFVLGAGASSEVGLPIGGELAKKIADGLNIHFDYSSRLTSGDVEVLQALRIVAKQQQKSINEYVHAARSVSQGILLAGSIDNFIDNHKDNEIVKLCGKLAIVRSILSAEWASQLYVDKNTDDFNNEHFSLLRSTWYGKFFQILSEGIPVTDLDRLFSNVAVIDFNYDRCLQTFLTEAVRALYNVDSGSAVALVRKLKVLRPYGSVGHLPLMAGTDEVPFGGHEGRSDVLLQLSKGVRTYTEQVEEGENLENIRREIAEADVIVFLGFAFHRQNMKLLSYGTGAEILTSSRRRRAYATAYGVSDSDCDVVRVLITGLSTRQKPPTIFLRNDLKCAAMFDQYWRSFSMR